MQHGEEIVYESRQLKSCEFRYPTLDLEWAAIVSLYSFGGTTCMERSARITQS